MLIENEFHYPVILKLKGKKCVIIGGGQVAARKLSTLCEAGAEVTVIAPEFCALLKEAARKHQCRLLQDYYKAEYIQQAFIVIAATKFIKSSVRICRQKAVRFAGVEGIRCTTRRC